MTATFLWHDRLLPYWDEPYNNTRNNERAVELAIARAWLRPTVRRRAGLEVGNVLAHYDGGRHWPRRIVDLTEQAEGVENIDVAAIRGTYPWIVSISTIEHVGHAEYSQAPAPMAATEALLHLVDLLAPGGRMLVTVPLGYNPDLDTDLAMGAVGVLRQCTLHRTQNGDAAPVWTQAAAPVAPLPYDSVAASAAAVWIGEW